LAEQSSAISASTIPTFVIKAVDRNKLVTIQTDTLVLNDSYIVTMGVMGSRGINGIKVATIEITDDGRVTKTFTIPDALQGLSKIAIRLQSPTTGYYSYNWFYNFDANLHLRGPQNQYHPPQQFIMVTHIFMSLQLIKLQLLLSRDTIFPRTPPSMSV